MTRARHLNRLVLGLAFVSSSLMASLAHSADYTYDFNYAGLTGTIVTSCDSCAVGPSDLVSWMFSGPGPDGGSIAFNSSGSDAEERSVGSGLQATPTRMTYAFTPSSPDEAVFYDNAKSLYLVSFPTIASISNEDVGEWGVCTGTFPFAGENGGSPGGGSQTCRGGIPTGVQTVAQIAKVASAPELDPRGLMTSLMLFVGTMAVLLGRRVRAHQV